MLATDPDGLRYYQRAAVDAVIQEHKTCRSTLVVIPTGGGKTQVFAALAGAFEGRVLILAHRKELVLQARDRVEQMHGVFCDVEMADRSSYSSRIVSGSIQSVCQQGRLDRLGRDAFDLVIIDEVHHATSSTYRKIIDWFSGAKILGVTATPDRGDGEALGQVMDSVAYRMGMLDGIEWGYLCPIHAERVYLDSIDISSVKTSAGDLQVGQLDAAIVEAVTGVVKETLARAPTQQGVAFFPGVRSALLAAESFNAADPGCARFVCGETAADERDAIMAGFKRGDFRWLCNVGVATEGFDCPSAEVVVIARPTKSRSLYAQMGGRGARVLPSAGVDAIPGPDGAAMRREAISKSDKPRCLILDFYGNSGKHSLCTPVDLLAGKFSEHEVALAKAAEERLDGPADTLDTLVSARKEMAEIAALTRRAKVRSRSERVDPFAHTKGRLAASPGREAVMATQPQLRYLESIGYEGDARKLSKRQASEIITRSAQKKSAASPRASIESIRVIGRYVAVPATLDQYTATRAISYIDNQGRQRKPVYAAALKYIIKEGRANGTS